MFPCQDHGIFDAKRRCPSCGRKGVTVERWTLDRSISWETLRCGHCGKLSYPEREPRSD